MGQSLKQKWSYERLFSHKGSLNGITTRLNQIAYAHSTLPEERTVLLHAIDLINRVDLTKSKDLSWKQFQEEVH